MNLTPTRRLVPLLDAAIDAATKANTRKPKSVHASSILDCQRKQVYGLLGYDPDSPASDPRWTRTADFGTVIHDRITQYFADMGILEAAEMSLPENDYGIGGRVDYILHIDEERVIVDVKTMDEEKYYSYHGSEKQSWAYAQVQLYLHLLKLKRGYILTVSRNKAEWQEYEVIYSPDHAKWLTGRAQEIMLWVREGIVPVPDIDGIPAQASVCRFCGFRERCKAEEVRRRG